MARTGRPTKMTEERITRFVTAIRGGSYIDIAATFAGLDRSTVFRWMAAGREAKSGRFRDFYDRVKEAEAAVEIDAIARVRTAAQDPRNWTAAMTFLERRFRDRWARPPGMASAADGASGSQGGQGAPADVSEDDVITVPIEDRVAGILRTLERVDRLPATSANGNGHPEANR